MKSKVGSATVPTSSGGPLCRHILAGTEAGPTSVLRYRYEVLYKVFLACRAGFSFITFIWKVMKTNNPDNPVNPV